LRARLSTSPDAAALLSALQPDSRRALSTAIEVAEGLGAALYLVGGGVRDLLLGGSTRDLDLAVEGSAADLAAEACRGATAPSERRW
jgi:tRNA nucleotidyltransferase/poly(A) polymerase